MSNKKDYLITFYCLQYDKWDFGLEMDKNGLQNMINIFSIFFPVISVITADTRIKLW